MSRILNANRHTINLCNLHLTGRILDIGGGGEGIVSRVCGENVVVIDKRREELEETPDVGLKIVMDATKMRFLDDTFDYVTTFFSLMYMAEHEISAVLWEVFRVLRPGGRLLIWDAVIPPHIDTDVFVVQLDVQVPHGYNITPGYGIKHTREQTLEQIQGLCLDTGFIKRNSGGDDWVFHIRCRKPSWGTQNKGGKHEH